MIRISPAARISLGLVFISLSVLLFGNFIGLIEDQSVAAMKARKSTAESLAVQCTLAARYNNFAAIKKTMDAIVELHPDVLSLGMRDIYGNRIVQTQDHPIRWATPPGDDSTSTHWQIPIHQGTKRWATLEISFVPEDSVVVLGYELRPFTLLLALFAVVSFLGFLIFMKRSLRDLDPTTVMPSRVKYMLDTLTEGVILMDTKECIILANSALAEKLGRSVEALMGLKASKLNWVNPETHRPFETLPWIQAMSQGEIKSNIPFNLDTGVHGIQHFRANVAPILDDKGNSRGALVTFDDVTKLENKNIELAESIEMLQKSRYQVDLQNQQLEILATQDSLTGCLNRRAFFAKAEEYMAATASKGSNLACIMADIDLFKSVNDRYGHAIGDQVIQFIARSLQSVIRKGDALCRYGGEEFCILLPNSDIENAAAIAERVRGQIEVQSVQAISEKPGISISTSFGVSDLSFGAKRIEELIEQADSALYNAKEGGRNIVISWNGGKEKESLQQVKNG